MKHLRGFLLSLGFLALAWLAFNPQTVVKIQSRLGLTPETVSQTPIDSPTLENPVFDHAEDTVEIPPSLPVTPLPDEDDLPRIAEFGTLAKDESWIGSTPCSHHIFSAPATLRSLTPRQPGPRLTDPIKATDSQSIKDQPTYLYVSERGITLKLVKPVISYYDVNGQRYRDTQNDIFSRRPLEILRQSEREISPDIQEEIEKTGNRRTVTLADISSPSSLSYRISGARDRYRLDVKQTELTASFLITLPRWVSYDKASARDQARWDDLLCNAAHHELGHLRIRLDMLAETLDGYADLPPAGSFKEMEEVVRTYRTEVSSRIDDRQKAYHIYNGGGLRRGMVELPYADLPFPWLNTSLSETKTAEQLPE